MFAFNVDESLTKELMNKLLKESCFDIFEVRKVEIVSFAYFEINGEKVIEKAEENMGNSSNNESENETEKDGKIETEKATREKLTYSTWETLRPYAFNVIKGGKTPKLIKIVFSLPQNLVENLHENAAAMFLNFVFDNGIITFTAATSEKKFSMDKSLNHCLEDYLTNYFSEMGLTIIPII